MPRSAWLGRGPSTSTQQASPAGCFRDVRRSPDEGSGTPNHPGWCGRTTPTHPASVRVAPRNARCRPSPQAGPWRKDRVVELPRGNSQHDAAPLPRSGGAQPCQAWQRLRQDRRDRPGTPPTETERPSHDQPTPSPHTDRPGADTGNRAAVGIFDPHQPLIPTRRETRRPRRHPISEDAVLRREMARLTRQTIQTVGLQLVVLRIAQRIKGVLIGHLR